MGKLVLVRHGESRWNLSNKFTGWVDVPLTGNGIEEAKRCADFCKQYEYSAAYCSKLARAQETLLIILYKQEKTGVFQHKVDNEFERWVRASNICDDSDIPIFATRRLNERFYGALQGMDKNAAEKKYGKEKVHAWRRSYVARPPRGESLEDAHARMLPYLTKTILPRVKKGENIIVVGHGNTLRAVVKHLENISNNQIAYIDFPEAQPLVYEFCLGNFVRIEGEYQMDRPLR